MKTSIVALVVSLWAGLGANAQERTYPAKVQVRTDRESYAPGSGGKLIVTFSVTSPWHLYGPEVEGSVATRVVPQPAQGVTWGAAEYPEPIVRNYPSLGGELKLYEGTVDIVVPFTLSSDFNGAVDATLLLDYQACTDKKCLMPIRGETVQAKIAATGSPAQPAAPRTAEGEAERQYEERGFFGFLLMAMLGGLVSLLMPCVYPLVPITLTYFTKQADGSRAKSALLSWSYALGILVTFVGAGTAFTLILGPDGPRFIASNAWVNLAIAALFLYFAFSLFGLYEIRLPSFFQSGAPRKGLGGAFILGLAFAVVTFTCTIPIAATVLSLASGSRHAGAGILAMVVYALTMASPFLLLGLFPGLIRKMPRSGGWLQTAKVVAAFVELALAAQYLANADLVLSWGVVTRTVLITTWVAVGALVTFYLLGVFRTKHDAEESGVGIGRVLTALVFAMITVHMASGLTGRPLGIFETVLPPDTSSTAQAPGGRPEIRSEGTLDEALAKARETGKPVFVEFTGVT